MTNVLIYIHQILIISIFIVQQHIHFGHATIAVNEQEPFFTVKVFENGENLNVNDRGKQISVTVKQLNLFKTPIDFGTYLQRETGILPLKTKLKHLNGFPIEARNEYGIPISGLNISDHLQHVFLLVSSHGSHWMWYTFPTANRIVLNDIVVKDTKNNNSKQLKPVEIECLSSSPKVFKVYNLLSDSECDDLIALGKNNGLRRSEVGYTSDDDEDHNEEEENVDQGGSISNVRTFETVFDNGEPLAIKIKKRISKLIRMPYDHSESYDGIQILRYNISKAYDLHEDYFLPEDDEAMNFDVPSGGTNRYLTVMLYLNDVKKGGQTVFPLSPNGTNPSKNNRSNLIPSTKNETTTWEQNLTKKCEDGNSLSVEPTKGAALLFYSLDQYSIPDKNSLHGGCPVLDGKKYAANVWVWSRSNGFEEKPCADEDVNTFDIVNRIEDETQQLAIYSYTKTNCTGCDDASTIYHGRLEHGEYITVSTCPLDIYISILVPTEHIDHEDDDDLIEKMRREEKVIFSTESFLVDNRMADLNSKEIIFYKHDNINIQDMNERYIGIQHKWMDRWKDLEDENENENNLPSWFALFQERRASSPTSWLR